VVMVVWEKKGGGVKIWGDPRPVMVRTNHR
jgi:hypothetical protein